MTEVLKLLSIVIGTALIVEKVVSFARHGSERWTGTWSTYWWNALAFALGVGVALGWNINVMPGLTAQVPALAGTSAFTGTSGEVLTGLMIGAGSGFWYGVLSALEGTVVRNRATAGTGK